jgi:hypothetical protein
VSVIDSLRRWLSIHHTVCAALLLCWCVQLIIGTLSQSRTLVMLCGLTATAPLYVLLASLGVCAVCTRDMRESGVQAELLYRLHENTSKTVEHVGAYYAMIGTGLLSDVTLVCIIPFLLHSSL